MQQAEVADALGALAVVATVSFGAALARAFALETPAFALVTGTERWLTFAAATVLALVAAAVWLGARAAERAERRATKQPRACAPQRAASLAAGVLLVLAALAVLLLLLAATTSVRDIDALGSIGLLAPVALLTYAASTVPFRPLPRLPPAK